MSKVRILSPRPEINKNTAVNAVFFRLIYLPGFWVCCLIMSGVFICWGCWSQIYLPFIKTDICDRSILYFLDRSNNNS